MTLLVRVKGALKLFAGKGQPQRARSPRRRVNVRPSMSTGTSFGDTILIRHKRRVAKHDSRTGVIPPVPCRHVLSVIAARPHGSVECGLRVLLRGRLITRRRRGWLGRRLGLGGRGLGRSGPGRRRLFGGLGRCRLAWCCPGHSRLGRRGPGRCWRRGVVGNDQTIIVGDRRRRRAATRRPRRQAGQTTQGAERTAADRRAIGVERRALRCVARDRRRVAVVRTVSRGLGGNDRHGAIAGVSNGAAPTRSAR